MPKARAAQDGGAGGRAADLAVAWRSFSRQFLEVDLGSVF